MIFGVNVVFLGFVAYGEFRFEKEFFSVNALLNVKLRNL